MSGTLQGYALSRQQQRIWTAGRHDTVQLAVRFPAHVTRAAIEAAVRRHEIFGARFSTLPGLAVPLQSIGEIDLERNPLIRVETRDDGVTVFTASALAADALSLCALAADVVRPAAVEVQYIDYAEWQRETFGAAPEYRHRDGAPLPRHEIDVPHNLDAPTLLAAWQRVLHGALPEWDGTLAILVHDRGDAALEQSVGPFARVVLLRGEELLARAAGSLDSDDSDAGEAPGFAWLDVPEGTPPVESLRFTITGSPLQLIAWRQGSTVHASVLGEWAELLAGRVAAELRGDPIGDADRALIEAAARGRSEPSWRETSLVRLFERHAAQTPGRLAVDSLTYAELDRRANGIAQLLVQRGAGPDVVVALLADRGADAVAGLLGILKSGAAYAPLPPDAPPLRLAQQLAVANVSLAVARRADAGAVPVDTVFLEDAEPADGIGRDCEPEQLACVIFTSGSTGTPKGVMVTHGGIASYVRFLAELLGCTGDRPLTFATGGALVTDLGNTAVFGALATGGTLHAASRAELTEATAFRAFMRGVDVLKIVPSHYQALLTGTPADAAIVPRVALLFGGEILPVPLFERVRALAPECRVINHYGPTETTIGSLVCDGYTPRADDRSIPIGSAIANTTVRILRAGGTPALVGESAELYLGGAGAARGYAGDPAATAERFVPDPFAANGERLYRTGDLARLRPDGRIEFLGRADQQVKIRGYRVEPAEVEQQLAAHPSVDDAAVLAQTIGAEPRLVAFVAARRVERATLPNGLAVAEHRRHETEFFYRQIFERDPFAASGLDIPHGGVVFDVGANIGLFTLYAQLAAPGVRVFAFEPLPDVFARLEENASGYGVDARLVNAAVGERAGTCDITYFPEESCMSGLYSDAERDAAILARIYENDAATGSLSETDRARLVAERTAAVRIPTRVVTLSGVIREHGIAQLDLLKIDVERSEWDVLAGLADDDWPKVRQITIEAHDVDGRVARLAELLRERGFEVDVEQDPAVAGTELYDVHARRPGMPRAARRQLAIPPPPASATESSLRAFLAARLPDYMVPQAFVFVEAIPRTASGKIDRRLLLDAAGRHEPARTSEALATTAEEILAGVFSQVLGVEHVGPTDNFFTLGGDSIRSIQVRYRAAERGVSFTTEQLFAHPTVRELAAVAGSERERETDIAPFALLGDEDRRKLPAGIEDAFPLTMLQSGMIFHGVYDEGSALYHDVQRFVVEGSFEPAAFRAAIDRLLDRHSVLRTSFDLRRYSEPLQLVHAPGSVSIPLEIADLRELDASAQTARVQAWIDSEKVTSFDLAVPPLVRFAVFVLSDRRFVFCLSTHHPVVDGWSNVSMLSELLRDYLAILDGRPPLDFGRTTSMRSYVAAERAELASAESRAFWDERLAGSTPSFLSFPPVDDVPRDHLHVANRSLGDDVSEKLLSLARRLAVPVRSVLLAAHARMLAMLTGSDDVLTGIVANCRPEAAEAERYVGLFLNTVPFRQRLPRASWEELIVRTFAAERELLPHRRYPLAQIIFSRGREALFDTLFDFTHFHVLQSLRDLPMKLVDWNIYEETNFTLAAMFRQDAWTGELGVALHGDVRLMTAADVERIADAYVRLLAHIASDPAASCTLFPSIDDAFAEQLATINATRREYDAGATIDQLIDARAAAAPDARAIVAQDRMLTFAELRDESLRLAHHLRAAGAGPERRVAVCMARSSQLMVALLAVLRTGAAYVPIDPSYPRDRRELILRDCDAVAVVTEGRHARSFARGVPVIDLDRDRDAIAARPATPLDVARAANGAAYVIYTSGSTGRPKGVVVTHRNVVNFFAGMDDRVPGETGVFLAVTSVSFDISVLELFWTLARGFEVVIRGDETAARRAAGKAVALSLFYFGSDSEAPGEKYRLLLEGARFADEHGFEAIWTPERHIHRFGGLYPNPSLTSAAVAAVTRRIHVRAGSVVVPLHHPLRIAEEWSVIDNLSGGRVGLSVASGWHSDDFVFAPENYAARRDVAIRGVDEVRRLWRGEAVSYRGGAGGNVETRLRPQPVQRELPVWLTAMGNPDTFRSAGELGLNVLTHLLGQTEAELREKIAIYRAAWRAKGHPGEGRVTLMLHAFVGEDRERVRETVRGPLREYMRGSVDLLRALARAQNQDTSEYSDEDVDRLLDGAFGRYFERAGLMGTIESCCERIDEIRGWDVDEIACFVDFGVADDTVLASLPNLAAVRDYAAAPLAGSLPLREEIALRGVTHLQATPSYARMLLGGERGDLASLRTLLVGGDALPPALAAELARTFDSELHNMYGPTETTIWSTTAQLAANRGFISIGSPVANTTVHVVDRHGNPTLPGVAGELLIGGHGVTRGYHARPALTASRFLPDPWSSEPGARVYRTGDVARFRTDGALELLGRQDGQVKIRGYRVELGEIETALLAHDSVSEAVAVARDDGAGARELAAYVVPREGAQVTARELRDRLRDRLPEYMVPSHLITLDALPLTPNRKVDRKALPAPSAARAPRSTPYVAPRSELELRLAAIWGELLGAPSIGVHDDFFELGGHSLLALRLMSRVEELLSRAPSLSVLFRNPTIAAFAAALQDLGAVRASSSLAVPLSQHRGAPRLFCIHPSGGDVVGFLPLAETLGSAFSVTGIRARGLETGETPMTTLAEFADAYTAAIVSEQPRGPYALAGWSFGGVAAFEVARRLLARGEEVASLFLFDAWAPHPARPAEPQDDESIAREVLAQSGAELELASPAARRRVDVYRACVRAAAADRGAPLDVRVTLFRARHPEGTDESLGWRAFAEVEVIDVPATHATLLARPAVELIGEEVRSALATLA